MEKKSVAPGPVGAVESHVGDSRLANPTPQPVSKSESSGSNGVATEEEQKTSDGDAQRPQRWGFWRGNR